MTKVQKFFGRNKTTFAITLMMLPGAIWLLLIRYVPMAGIVIAFQDYRPHPPNPTLINNILNSRWVGLDNFRFMFASADALRMIRNTLAYNAVFIVLTMVIAVAFAIMLSEITKKFMAKLYQTLMFFPFVISWVVVSYFVFAFLAPTYGLLSHITNWYMDPTWWPLILTSANLWKNVGYSCIMYLVAITSIDTAQYEAASIDGATKWQQVWNVTIPHIKPMIVILLILAAGRIFNADFGLFYNVTLDSGPLYPVTDVVDTYVFRALQRLNNIGMSTAAGLFQNVVGFICIMLVNGIVRKLEPDHALF
ncbi:MAG: ABC transporter permease subunit [Firmicutes bacterium]|nr:ABC transporter permease subunit [Bacillota bacterium]